MSKYLKSNNDLCIASKKGDLVNVIMLLDEGSNPNIKDINEANLDGYTPLIWSVSMGYTYITKLLLKSGADFNIEGKNLLKIDEEKGYIDIILLKIKF